MMAAFNLRTAAEQQARNPFSEDEYRHALSAARQKLEYINNRSGTRHGEPYLAVLIAEAVEARRLTQYLEAVSVLREKPC